MPRPLVDHAPLADPLTVLVIEPRVIGQSRLRNGNGFDARIWKAGAVEVGNGIAPVLLRRFARQMGFRESLLPQTHSMRDALLLVVEPVRAPMRSPLASSTLSSPCI